MRRHVRRFHARPRAARNYRISEMVCAPIGLAEGNVGDAGIKDAVAVDAGTTDFSAVGGLGGGGEFPPPVSAGEMSSLLSFSTKAELSSSDAFGFTGLLDRNPPLPSPSLSDLLEGFPDLGAISGNSLLTSLDLDLSVSPGNLMPVSLTTDVSALELSAAAVDSSRGETVADIGETGIMTSGTSKGKGKILDSSPESPKRGPLSGSGSHFVQVYPTPLEVVRVADLAFDFLPVLDQDQFLKQV